MVHMFRNTNILSQVIRCFWLQYVFDPLCLLLLRCLYPVCVCALLPVWLLPRPDVFQISKYTSSTAFVPQQYVVYLMSALPALSSCALSEFRIFFNLAFLPKPLTFCLLTEDHCQSFDDYFVVTLPHWTLCQVLILESSSLPGLTLWGSNYI